MVCTVRSPLAGAVASEVMILPRELRRRAACSRTELQVLMSLLCAALILPGCTTIKPTEFSAQDKAVQFRERKLTDNGLGAFATRPTAGFSTWPPSQWDARSLDLSALYFNPSLSTAHARWEAAQAEILSARQIPNPTLQVTPQYVVTAPVDIPAWVLAVSLVQIFETAGKREYRAAQARYLAEAARFDGLSLAWQTIGAVNEALLDINTARRRIGALDSQITAQTALAEIAAKLVIAGLGSSLEVTTARTALNRAVLEKETAKGALTAAQHRLAQAVGVPVEAIPVDRIVAVGSANIPSTDFRLKIREDAALNRADLLARLADYGASDAALQLEVARQYPDLQLGPAYDYDQGDHKWGLSLGLTLPIFNQNQGGIAKAVALRRQAADEFIALQARIIGDVDRAIAAYDSAARAASVASDIVRRQTNQLRAQQALFDRGEAGQPALLAARVEVANATLAEVDAQTALEKTRLALEMVGQRLLNGFDPASLIFRERK